MKIFHTIIVICAGLCVLGAGCVTEPQSAGPVIIQSPPEYSIKVLLDSSAEKVSFRIEDEYQIVNYDTMEILQATGSSDAVEATIDNNSIRVGQQIFKSSKVIIQPKHNQPFVFNETMTYRGGLELIINSDKKTLTVINNVPMESYLAGVVASEMPSYWETEALKAQAIAARTYCLYIKSKFGKNRSWDVKTTQANQVYRGVRAETIRTTDAVNSTFGIILCDNEFTEPFPAYYSSACGGHTEDSQNVFGDSFESLKGVDCQFCRTTTRPSLFYWPDVKFDKETVNKNIFEKYPTIQQDLDSIKKIEAVKESKYDNNFARITSVKLTGSNGKTAFLRAEDLRLAIDSTGSKIQSASCTIISLDNEFIFTAGKGFGHGVGLCQYGAREMARQGKTAEEILSFYYPGCRFKSMY